MANEPTPSTAEAHRALLADPLLDWSDHRDFEAARRGFVAALDPPVIHCDDGQVAWDLEEYGFLADETAPGTVNPSLWRQARLNMEHGLFQIHDRIWQVRGYDLSVMSVGDTDLAAVHTPAIPALRWSLEDVGRAAADLLLRRLGGDAGQAQSRALLPVDLVLRDSCAPPKTA